MAAGTRAVVACVLALASLSSYAALCSEGQDAFKAGPSEGFTGTGATAAAACSAWEVAYDLETPDTWSVESVTADLCTVLREGGGGVVRVTAPITQVCALPGEEINWADPASILQALFWCSLVLVGFHGFSVGGRSV